MPPVHIEAFIEAPQAYLARRAAWYRSDRHLRHLQELPLNQRLDDLIANLWTTDNAGAAVAITEPRRREFILTRLIDIREERRIRGRGAALDVDETALRQRGTSGYAPAKVQGPIPTMGSQALVRYSSRRFVEEALFEGRFRLNAAATYADKSLNAAQLDDELSHHAVTPNAAPLFQIWGRTGPEGPIRKLRPRPLEQFRYIHTKPFYVLCLSDRFDFRMFHDFSADAALVVHDRDEFARRLNGAAAKVISASGSGGRVRYYDPYSVNHADLIPGFSKHFRFAYQNEVRMTWTPASGATPGPVDIVAGALRDIAEIVVTTPSNGQA